MALLPKKEKSEKVSLGSYFKSRKFKYGSVSTALTAVFIAIVVIINVIFSLLTDAYAWELDLTDNDLYSISTQSKQIVNTLTKNQKIKFTVMYDESEYPSPFADIVKRFAALSENIELTFIDTVANPTALNSFGEEYSITEGAVVVESQARLRVVNFEDMYTLDDTTGSVSSYNVEERLAAAILYVTQEDVPLTYFLYGHGESGYDAFMSLIANNGSDVEEVQINQLDTFDEMAKTMVICGPMRDYSEAEIRKLQDFLANDYSYERNLFYFSSPESPKLPNLEAFLAEWEIELDHTLVLEDDNHNASTYASKPSEAPLFTIPSYVVPEEEGAIDLSASVLCVIPYTGGVRIVNDERNIVDTIALLTTSEGSYAKSTDAIISGYGKTKEDLEGPFTLAAIATKSNFSNNVEQQSHVFVAGSVAMLDQSYITYNGNGEYLFNIYQLMVDETELEVAGATKTVASSYMTLDETTTTWAYVLILGVIPILCLVIGAIVFIRRRFL